MNIKKITSLVSAIAVSSTMLIQMPLAHAQASTLEVGADKTYHTIHEAVAAAKALNPQSEADRVTINVDPGDYEEQVRIDGAKYITIQQTPNTDGRVNLSWYYCTGYCAANANLSGLYDPDIDWSLDETWNGYNEGDEKFTKYEIGQILNLNNDKVDIKTPTISYYDKNGVKHKDAPVSSSLTHLGSLVWGYDKMAPLIVTRTSTDITIKDLNLVNSIPVMVTQGQKDAHVAPEADRLGTDTNNLLDRSALAICDETTPLVKPTADIFASDGSVDKVKYTAYAKTLTDAGKTFTAGESAWLANSSAFNERGHAIAILGDRVIVENVRVRGNQDSVWVSDGRTYFKNCDLLGGTDYIYGSATAVFDNCTLGFVGFTDKTYGSPLATPNTSHERKYGYLFWNCTVYNLRSNNGANSFGGSWGGDGQATYIGTTLDNGNTLMYGASKAVITDAGWDRFDAEKGLSRLYEYGTKNADGTPVDLSKRIVNKSVEEGGPGMGTVLDKWQALEFNPRNCFSKERNDSSWSESWDPMNFAAELATVDSQMDAAEITVPAGEATEVSLPAPTDSNIEFHWVSASTNAVVSNDETKMTVTRPALGEDAIVTSVILYARDKTTGYGDKKEIPVTINATTDNTNVFNIPVTISQSVAGENEYTVTISKEGALIKEQVIPVTSTETTAVIENIPASASGINYDVKIVSKSDNFSITAPADGKTTVKGVTGADVPLNISAQKLVDETVKLNINTNAAAGNKAKLDLIALAKEAGADDSISSSDSISVQFEVKVNKALAENSFVDISSGNPSNANSATKQRFTAFKINQSWKQIDSVDNSQGFSGSSSGDGQCLNLTGTFIPYPSTHTVRAIIDYKNQTVSVEGSNVSGGKYTFAHFPENAEKGKLNMGIFVGSTSDDFEISKVKVTYKRLVTDDEPLPTEAPLPSGVGTYVFPADRDHVVGGNQCDNSDSLVFLDTADARLKEILKDDTDSTKIKQEYVGHYLNYIVGTTEGRAHPKITLNAPAGHYTVYLVGYNNDNNVKVIVDGETYYAEDGVAFAAKANNSSYVLKSYKVDVKIKEADDEITFDSGNPFLPDAYVFAVDGKEAPPVPTAAPTGNPTAAPTGNPTAAPTGNPTAAPTGNPTAAPTGNPTTAPTGNPTTPPSPSTGRITGAIITNGGKTKVTLEGITSGVVVAAKYDNGKMTAVKTVSITEDTPNPLTIDDIEANKIMVWKSLDSMEPLCEPKTVLQASPGETPKPITETVTVDFTAMSAALVYNAASGQGFVTKSSAIMPSGSERQVAPASAITVSEEGAKITETTGSYLHKKNNSNDGDDYNNGGLIYRIDTGKPGAYHLEVEVTGTNADTIVAPTGMNGGNLTGTGNWDNCEQVKRTVSAKWNGNVWSYDFATGEDFVEIEIEPKSLASASDAKTVGVKKITVAPLENNSAGDKPTIHILGDSTQKSYSFNETISAWGQTLKNYFDLDKVNVVNYSMGGRAMKSNYCEGRFDEILIRGKEGDFVFIHSAHNDETVSTNRFSRGAGTKSDDLTVNNENYNKWLNMYVEAIKARGMTPVLVTAMPRVNGSTGKYNESQTKPNGFNPDSPANMRAKAKSDPEVGLAELYAGAKAYIDKLDGKEIAYIYNNIEAGETPAANAANGAKGDGTHYKEAAAKQWSRIILQSIYDQSVASTDTYTDKDIMTKLVSLMPQKVKTAAQTGDWSEVFPEMASDVSAVDVVPNATKQVENNFYYRNNIEKALQLGLLHKDTQNLFKPTKTITVGEFARGIEKAFGLEANSLTNYTKTYAELSAETSFANLMSLAYSNETDNGESGNYELYADGDGELTITVEQPTGGTVTVYNNSAFGTYTADVTDAAAAGQVISNNEYFKLTAPAENFAKNTRSSGVFADNPAISKNYINFRKASSGSCIVEYVAKASGKLIVYASAGTTKPVALAQKDDSSSVQSHILEGSPDSSNICGTATFNVVADTTYELYTSGGTGMLFGVKYESTDYPQSTTSLSVNSGDEIRVVATPAENHVNGSILVNGEAKTTSKEYTFTADGNTTVSATFISEPALVEVTKIASDAALTREAMGAILYDAYQAFQENGDDTAKEYMARYMSNNGGVPSPSDPNYDPNIQYEGSPYIPTVGWGALTDTNDLTDSLYMKVKNAYNLGLMRSEQGIGRGQIGLGTELEPKAEVTRAKAAKTLVFAFTLTQKPNDESQLIPEGFAVSAPAEIALPNANAQTVVFN